MVRFMHSRCLGGCAGRVVASLRLRNRSIRFEQSMKELIKQATILAYLLPSHTIKIKYGNFVEVKRCQEVGFRCKATSRAPLHAAVRTMQLI